MKTDCEICGKPGTHWKRCDEHYCCGGCGTTEDICFYGKGYGLLCESCQAREAEKRVREFDGDTDYEDAVICPHCGNEITDDLYEYDDGDVEECEYCRRTFVVAVYQTIQFSTRKEG